MTYFSVISFLIFGSLNGDIILYDPMDNNDHLIGGGVTYGISNQLCSSDTCVKIPASNPASWLETKEYHVDTTGYKDIILRIDVGLTGFGDGSVSIYEEYNISTPYNNGLLESYQHDTISQNQIHSGLTFQLSAGAANKESFGIHFSGAAPTTGTAAAYVDNLYIFGTPIPTVSPTTSVPTTQTPTSSVPTTSSPTTNVPTSSIPTTVAPTTLSPTTSIPTTQTPTTSVPTTHVPTVTPTTLSPTRIQTTIYPTSLTPTYQTGVTFPVNTTENGEGHVEETTKTVTDSIELNDINDSTEDNVGMIVAIVIIISLTVIISVIVCIHFKWFKKRNNRKYNDNKFSNDQIELDNVHKSNSNININTITMEGNVDTGSSTHEDDDDGDMDYVIDTGDATNAYPDEQVLDDVNHMTSGDYINDNTPQDIFVNNNTPGNIDNFMVDRFIQNDEFVIDDDASVEGDTPESNSIVETPNVTQQ